MTTLSQVARRAGVSPATASRVISNSDYGVTEGLRARVLEAAQELDYVPNAHAQALVHRGTHAVGVIAQDVSDPYFSEVVRGVQRVASGAGRLVTVCNSYRDPERELDYFKLLRSQRVEAIVLASSGFGGEEHVRKLDAQIAAFKADGGRVALIGRHHVAGDNVIPDNLGGARALGRELVRLGHRRFGVVGGPAELASSVDKLEGFLGALVEHGIDLPSGSIVEEGDFSRDGGFRSALELLDGVPGLTAIFAANDQIAVGVLAALREKHIAVPDEVSVAGFNDFPIARDLFPALSTVRLPLIEMGARATELALQPAGPEPRVERLSTEVILRQSTARARDQ